MAIVKNKVSQATLFADELTKAGLTPEQVKIITEKYHALDLKIQALEMKIQSVSSLLQRNIEEVKTETEKSLANRPTLLEVLEIQKGE